MRWRKEVEVDSGKLFALILGCLVTATSFAGRTANQEWVKERGGAPAAALVRKRKMRS